MNVTDDHRGAEAGEVETEVETEVEKEIQISDETATGNTSRFISTSVLRLIEKISICICF